MEGSDFMSDVDGWITIGTKMDTSKFDKEYEKLKKKAQDQEVQINLKIEGINQAKEDLKRLEEEFDAVARDAEASDIDRYLELKYMHQEGSLTGEEEEEWFHLAKMADIYEDMERQMERKATLIEDTQQKIKNETEELEEEKKKYMEIALEIEKVNQKKGEVLKEQNINTIKSQIDNIGKSLQNVTKKVVRWGLAVFGVRSAYLFIRQAMSTLSSYNEQIATDLQYIRFAMASTLQPIIEYIIKLVITLLQYLGYVIKQLFGINIFKNSGVDKFQKGMANSAKSAKEIKKQLAGFDEMNILQDNSGGDTGAAGGVTPSVDFSKLKNGKVPKWLETIVEVGKWILDNWEDVVFTLLLVKLFIDLLTGNWIGVVIDLIGLLIIAFKEIWENLKDIIDIIKPYFKQFVDWISKNIVEPIGKFFKNLWAGISDGVKGAVNNIKSFFNSIPSFFSGIVNRITGFFRDLGYSAGNVIAGVFRSVVNGILRTIENVLNTPIRTINSLIKTVNKLPGVNISKLQTFSLPRLAKGGIVNNPGPGVMMGSYVAGERGPEAVLPLTDDTLQRLANMIPITVNVTNSMNGRVISREIQRVQNENNFALNR